MMPAVHATPAEPAAAHRPSTGYRIAVNALALVSLGWWIISVPHFAAALHPEYGAVMCWPAALAFPSMAWVLADYTHRLRHHSLGLRIRHGLVVALVAVYAVALSAMTYPLDNPGHAPWPLILWMGGMHMTVGYVGPLMITAAHYDRQERSTT
ncbi:hypothetical protein [Streptomyces sp. MJM8645]|uniref:hypothetical protein n=1 Tax=Streptomycetaceae TaxID=2062 RepID=UPI0007AF642E|nr:hypothetical protein [Streptomyces sp. MJM8645]